MSDTNQSRFAGKMAIVTGAGSGIGLATAKKIIDEGGTVVAVDVSAPRLEEAAAAIGAAYKPLAIDITGPGAAKTIVEAAGGRVDILINNAGIMDGFLPVGEVSDELWDQILAVNLTSMMRLMREVIPVMVAAKHGAIVNLSSLAAFHACAGVAYTVSKHGVIGLTKQTAVMYAKDGVRCNAVAPGGVATNVAGDFRSPLAAERLGAAMGASMGAVSVGMGQPEGLADAICFLADDAAASHVNGVVLPVDFGWAGV